MVEQIVFAGGEGIGRFSSMSRFLIVLLFSSEQSFADFVFRGRLNAEVIVKFRGSFQAVVYRGRWVRIVFFIYGFVRLLRLVSFRLGGGFFLNRTIFFLLILRLRRQRFGSLKRQRDQFLIGLQGFGQFYIRCR